jgi:hypothetical protein
MRSLKDLSIMVFLLAYAELVSKISGKFNT